VTPLVDVVLVLLIIFMVITPYLQQGVAVELPDASSSSAADATKTPLVVTVKADGTLWMGPQRVSASRLVERLRRELASRPDRQVLLRGDRHAHYGKVQEVLTWLRNAGAPAVELATTPEDRG